VNAKLFWLSVGSILYTYIGYPLMLAVLSRLRPRPRAYPETVPFVTMLIAAYNEEAVIATKLENSLALDYPRDRLQILVAADGSDDGTADIVQQFADRQVELSYSPLRRGKMAAINRAMPNVRGDIVIFSDANNIYSPDTLRQLVKPFSDPTVGAVSGAKVIAQDNDALGASEGLYWKYESLIKAAESRLGCCTGVAGEILAIRRDLFESPPDAVINDDFYIAMRIIARGYRVIYVPQARSTEYASASAQDELARRSRIVAGRYQAMMLAHRLLPFNRPLIVWQIVSHKFLRPLVPLAMGSALLTNIVAVLRPPQHHTHRVYELAPPFNWLLLVAQMLFYALAWSGSRREPGTRVGKLLYLPAFFVRSNFAAVIGLYRFLTRRQTTLWQRVQRRTLHADKSVSSE
jgi:cellulose synthase/poly-beta-1,6-N-acetylglucosamine synthase-like glycosyltransferase